MTPTDIPDWLRAQHRDRVALAARTTIGVPDATIAHVCQAAADVSRLYPWATASDIANALVDAISPSWGAIYLDWVAEQEGAR